MISLAIANTCRSLTVGLQSLKRSKRRQAISRINLGKGKGKRSAVLITAPKEAQRTLLYLNRFSYSRTLTHWVKLGNSTSRSVISKWDKVACQNYLGIFRAFAWLFLVIQKFWYTHPSASSYSSVAIYCHSDSLFLTLWYERDEKHKADYY